MSDHTSNRQKKHLAKEGAAALRQKPGWDPAQFRRESTTEQLKSLNQQEKNNAVYQEANTCQDCLAAQTQLQDPTALCQKHLAEAMGL